MTCIVAVKHGNKIFMGGDSAGSNGHLTVVRKDEKVFIKDEMIFGYTSSFRMGQLLRYKLKLPEHPKTLSCLEYLSTVFVDEVRKVFKEGGYLSKTNENESGGCFLIGYKGQIFEIESDFQVGICNEDYASVGSGDMVALGSLYSTSKKDPQVRIAMALEAASNFVTTVRPPFMTRHVMEKL